MSPGVLDEQVLAELRSIGGDAFVAELVEIYVADARPHLDSIRSAVAAGDASLLSAEAHALKSSSGNIGAVAVRTLCSELETAARSGDLAGTAAMVARLDAEYQRAVDELKRVAGASGAKNPTSNEELRMKNCE